MQRQEHPGRQDVLGLLRLQHGLAPSSLAFRSRLLLAGGLWACDFSLLAPSLVSEEACRLHTSVVTSQRTTSLPQQLGTVPGAGVSGEFQGSPPPSRGTAVSFLLVWRKIPCGAQCTRLWDTVDDSSGDHLLSLARLLDTEIIVPCTTQALFNLTPTLSPGRPH